MWGLICGFVTGCVAIQPPTPLPGATTQTPSTEEATITSTGTVVRGTTLDILLAPDLAFRLIPYGEDWEIWVGDPAQPEANYSQPLTPPLRGVNDRQIEGWHFRNADNSGPNLPGDQNVNAPQAIRRFCFARDPASFAQAISWAEARRDGTLAPAEAFSFVTSPGVLTITGLTLGNLVEGERAWIERMDYEVRLDLATPCMPF
jgi:hypothetical protein